VTWIDLEDEEALPADLADILATKAA